VEETETLTVAEIQEAVQKVEQPQARSGKVCLLR
jgi:hypothetical protein